MLRSGGVVIPMLPNIDTLELLVPHDAQLETFHESRPLAVYDATIIAFLDAWSKRLLAHPASRAYPDVVTFAFWIRKGHINQFKEAFLQSQKDSVRLGRGIIFHIAPSNVPVNFAYSLVVGLLAGNANIVKIPSKPFPQVDILCSILEEVLLDEQWTKIKAMLALVRYERTQRELTDWFSSFCDVRVVWGGDLTIEDVRKSSLPARSFDVCFADRYSLCVINADELVGKQDIGSVARGFYNDTYLFDQNACTAPHLVVWLGSQENKTIAKARFWDAVAEITGREYDLPAVTAVDKFMAFCREAIGDSMVRRELGEDNAVIRMRLEELPYDLVSIRGVGGYFNEFDATSIDEIVPIVTRKFQTLAYYGVGKTELQHFILKHRLVGIDRCVPIGKTLNFDVMWDGWDLIMTLSRLVLV